LEEETFSKPRHHLCFGHSHNLKVIAVSNNLKTLSKSSYSQHTASVTFRRLLESSGFGSKIKTSDFYHKLLIFASLVAGIS